MPASMAVFTDEKFSLKADASTTVTSVSNLARVARSSSVAKACATDLGSETPVDSTTRQSKRRLFSVSCLSSLSSFTSRNRSSLLVQQMQPLVSSTNFSFARTSRDSLMSFSSKLTAPTSFTRSATRTPPRFVSMCFKRVVLPAPKKPLKIVTGRRSSFLFASSSMAAMVRRCDVSD